MGLLGQGAFIGTVIQRSARPICCSGLTSGVLELPAENSAKRWCQASRLLIANAQPHHQVCDAAATL